MDDQNQKPVSPDTNNPQTKPAERESSVMQPSDSFVKEIKARDQVPTTPINTVQDANPPPVATSPATPLNSTGTQATGSLVGLTGSQMQEEKIPLPKGIYLIAGFNLLGFIISFFDTSQNSAIYSVVIFLDFLLAVGLLLKLEVARKVILWLTGITLVLTLVSFIILASLQVRLKQLKTNYETAISKLDQSTLTDQQKQQLASIKADIATKEKQVGKVIVLAYVKLGITAAETIAVMIYLTRPKVKEVFHKLEK